MTCPGYPLFGVLHQRVLCRGLGLGVEADKIETVLRVIHIADGHPARGFGLGIEPDNIEAGFGFGAPAQDTAEEIKERLQRGSGSRLL